MTDATIEEGSNMTSLSDGVNKTTTFLENNTGVTSFTTPIDTWIVDTALTNFSFITAPVLLVVGVFGNVLTLMVTNGRAFKHSSHGIYISAMAVADIMFLLSQPFNRTFAQYLFGRDLRTYSVAICKIYYFFLRLARPMSSLVILLICVERFVAVWFPLKSRLFSSRRSTKIQVCVVLAVSVAVSGFRTQSVGIQDGVCLAVARIPGNEQLVHWCSVLGMTVRTIIPTMTLLILTPPTVAKLFYQRRLRRELSNGNSDQSDETFHVSVMLLSVVVAFCILITPLCLTKHGYLFMGTNIVSTTSTWMRNVNEVRLICEQINCVINFILYVLLSTSFRREFCAILTCQRREKKKWHSSTQSSGRESFQTLNSAVSTEELKY